MKSQSTIGRTFFNKKNRVYQYGVLIVVLLLIVVSITFGAPPTRQLSELPENDYGSDTIYTMIRNSNGKYWSPTGANLQAAIDDLTFGGTVWLPNGTITVTSSVTLDDSISLIGAGIGVTTIYSNQSGAFNAISVIGKENVTLKGFTLDMNNKGQNGIYVHDGSKNVWIEDIYIYHYGDAQGIYCTECDSIFISNIKIEAGDIACKHGIGMTGCNNSRVTNAVFINNYPDVTEDAFDIGGTSDCYNITYDNIEIYGWYDGFKIAGGGTGARNIIISNVKVYGAENNALKLQGQYITIDGFYIENSPKGIATNTNGDHINIANGFIYNCGIGISLVDGSPENVTVSNVEVDTTSTFGISISGKNIQLSNVRILNAGSYNKISTGSSNILIDNCIFSYGAGMGLSIDNTNNFKITNCIFEGNEGDAIDTTISACNNYTIMGCTFINNAQGVDCHPSDDYNIITLNHFIGDTLDDRSATKGVIVNNIGDDI